MTYTCCLLSRPSISKRASLAAREERRSAFSRMATMQSQPSSHALGIAAPNSERACEVSVALAGTALKVIVTATTAKAAGAASLRRVPCKAKWAVAKDMVAYLAAKTAKLAPLSADKATSEVDSAALNRFRLPKTRERGSLKVTLNIVKYRVVALTQQQWLLLARTLAVWQSTV